MIDIIILLNPVIEATITIKVSKSNKALRVTLTMMGKGWNWMKKPRRVVQLKKVVLLTSCNAHPLDLSLLKIVCTYCSS